MQRPARKQGRNIQRERYALAYARASAIKHGEVTYEELCMENRSIYEGIAVRPM
jgi:hypothetical protein